MPSEEKKRGFKRIMREEQHVWMYLHVSKNMCIVDVQRWTEDILTFSLAAMAKYSPYKKLCEQSQHTLIDTFWTHN